MKYLLFLAVGIGGFAQALFTQTTLVGDMNSSQHDVTVASGTGIVAGQYAVVDNEMWAIIDVIPPGTTAAVRLNVHRAYQGKPSAHVAGSAVWVGTANQFSPQSPPSGKCPALSFVPVVTTSGRIVSCDSQIYASPRPALNRTAVNDADYTVSLKDDLIAVTALTAGRTITLPPATGLFGRQFMIVDESGAANSYNITVAGTINGATNATISTSYGVLRLYSNGTAWFKY